MRDITFFLCLQSHLCPGSGRGRTSSGKRLSLPDPEISHATGVLAEGTVISRSGSSLSVGLPTSGSKSSSLKASLENGHIPGLVKADVIFFTVRHLMCGISH